jgi:hypothetical protein
MRRLILFLFSLSLLTIEVFGQCEPNSAYTLPGIYPDSATGFPPAVANYEYNFVITAVIPADTIVFPLPRLPIDSIGVHAIIGLPDGFAAIPNRPSGYWLGGTSGCLLITGNPTQAQVGEYPLTIQAVGYMGGLGLPYAYEITYYSIIILDSTAFGIPGLANNNNLGLKAYPNPVSGSFFIEFQTTDPGEYEYLIYDGMNRLLLTKTFYSTTGKTRHKIDGSNLKPGLYFCVIRQRHNNISSAIKLVKY